MSDHLGDGVSDVFAWRGSPAAWEVEIARLIAA